MAQLFNKDGKGPEELEALTGQWYASSPYRIIASEIDFAERDLDSRVGSAVIDLAAGKYAAGETGGIVDAVRLPVACLAVLRHSALASVSHEATGRKVKMDENEKMPFEWMIDRDDRAMRERYYRALDALYAYLNDNAVPEWTSSEIYGTLRKSIVCTMADFEAVYPIAGSYYVYYMLQGLVIEAQDAFLQPMMGDKWSAVLDGSADASLAALSRRIVILSALITAGERWSLEVFPLEIARRYAPSYQGNRASSSATTAEIDWYIKKLESQRKQATNRLALMLDSSASGAAILPENSPRRKFFTTE